MKRKIFPCIMAVIIAIIGIGMIGSSIDDSDTTLMSVESISASQMTGDYDYEFTEAYIFDSYAQYEENDVIKTYYMSVVFYDASGDLCITSMTLEKGDAIYQDVLDYLNDDTLYVGDLVMPLYCTASSFNLDSEVGGYFSEYADELESYGYNTQVVPLQLDYMGSTLTEYEEAVASSRSGSIIMGVCLLLFAAALMIASVVSAKKAKTRANAKQTVPAQPVYQAPPQVPVRPAGVCPTCGEKVKSGAAFCGNCGTKL